MKIRLASEFLPATLNARREQRNAYSIEGKKFQPWILLSQNIVTKVDRTEIFLDVWEPRNLTQFSI